MSTAAGKWSSTITVKRFSNLSCGSGPDGYILLYCNRVYITNITRLHKHEQTPPEKVDDVDKSLHDRNTTIIIILI